MFKVHLLPLAVLVALTPLEAQELPGRLPNGAAVGMSGGVAFVDGERFYTVELHVSELRAAGVSADVTVSLPPQLLAYAIVLLADVAPAYNIALPGATLLLKAGPSLVAAAGGGGGAAYFGMHGGLGLLVRLGPNAALRLDLVERAYVVNVHLLPVPSVSIGLAALPVSR